MNRDLPVDSPVTRQVLNTPLTIIDSRKLIYHAYRGPLSAVSEVRDGGRRLDPGPAVDGASYIDAIDIAAGTYVVDLRSGEIRLGAPPEGVVAADIEVAGEAAADEVFLTAAASARSRWWGRPTVSEESMSPLTRALLKSLESSCIAAADALERREAARASMKAAAGQFSCQREEIEAIIAALRAGA